VDPKGEELAAVIAEIKQRVRARHPNGAMTGGIPLPDLTLLLQARDAAEGKVASIGSVNPRPSGPLNSLVQGLKRLVARALDWHVREQVEFNRAVMACVQSTLEVLNESNRAMTALSARIDQLSQANAQTFNETRNELQALRAEAQELKDIRTYWADWRVGWEQKLANSEIHLLRSVSELQAAFQHRVTLMDSSFREQIKGQHSDFEAALWRNLDRIREEYESIIHQELRLIRQKVSLTRIEERVSLNAPPAPADVDWLKFADIFRGTREAVRERQRWYAPHFSHHAPVLDIGCGRGEMLEVFRDAGIEARGVDLNEDSVALCHALGLPAERADLFAYLNDLPDSWLGGAVCCQVVEHLPPDRLPLLIQLLCSKLRPGGLVAIETPNPECLAIFATHFYRDPTHRHPIPAVLLRFYLEEAGFERVNVERLVPAMESMPSLAELADGYRKDFFGDLDYAIFAFKRG
jgi:2-polyprenyl-3-methyl-5-hydroxy-6-metoxy-1,4-benzoquinol methylase